MTASSSTVEATNDSYLNLASYSRYGKQPPDCSNTVENSSRWTNLYLKDKFFRLYTPDYYGWRYTIYGDDLANVTSSINLCWLHTEAKIPSRRKRTSLENFWAQEGYP